MGRRKGDVVAHTARADWAMRYLLDVVMRHHPSVANAPHLRAHGMRNTLWNAWTHRRLGSALRWTVFTLADTPNNVDWISRVRHGAVRIDPMRKRRTERMLGQSR